MNAARRADLPSELRERESLLRREMKRLEGVFPGTGLMLLAFDAGTPGHTSYISNASRADMVAALREQAERLEMGTADTAGRGEA